MDVEQIVKDSAVHARDPIKKRRRNYKVYGMLPLDVQTSAELGDGKQTTSPQLSIKKSAEKRQQTLLTDHTDDEQLIDEETKHRSGNLIKQLTPMITLESQKQDDLFISS
jgi:hypothetical protein